MEFEPTVSVVDDDALIRRTLCALIESAGMKAQAFASAEDFLRDYDPMSVACLLIDLRMPGMDGLALQDLLRQHDWTPPIVFFTAYGMVGSTVKAMRAGAFNFLEKPIAPDLLMAHIQEAVELGVRAQKNYTEQQEIRYRLRSLTDREREVLDLVVEGRTSREIASHFHRSILTINLHRTRILKKVKARNLAHLVRMITCLELPVVSISNEIPRRPSPQRLMRHIRN